MGAETAGIEAKVSGVGQNSDCSKFALALPEIEAGLGGLAVHVCCGAFIAGQREFKADSSHAVQFAILKPSNGSIYGT